MKRTDTRNWQFIMLLIFLFTMLFFSNPAHSTEPVYGTIGSRFTITGTGFSTKKPQVYIQYELKPGVLKKVSAKVEMWSESSITCIWTKKVLPGEYELFVQPKLKIGVCPCNSAKRIDKTKEFW